MEKFQNIMKMIVDEHEGLQVPNKAKPIKQ